MLRRPSFSTIQYNTTVKLLTTSPMCVKSFSTIQYNTTVKLERFI